MITFTDAENELIARLSIPGGWENADADGLKLKLKTYLLSKTSECCCYCRLSMWGWHRMTIDVEHVLPKARDKFPQYTFEPRNLSVSCKRCNMGIKRSDISFYIGETDEANHFQSDLYTFIHPNLDVANNHLKILVEQVNEKRLIKYVVLGSSAKGNATYEYFRLRELEVNNIDDAQGLDGVEPSTSLPPEIDARLKDCLDALNPSC